MAAPTLRIHTGNETQPTPAAESPAPVARVSADPDGWLCTRDVAAVLDGPTRESRERKAERLGRELEDADATSAYVRRESGELRFNPRTPVGLLLDGAVGTLAALVALKAAEPPALLHGLPIGPALRAAWETFPESKRGRVLADFQLAELREKHAADNRTLRARERDKRFNAAAREFADTHGFGHVGNLARAADRARRMILADRDPDGRGRPRTPWVPPRDIVELFYGVAFSPNDFALAEAIRLATAECRRRGVVPPSESSWRRWFARSYSSQVRSAIVKGPRATEARLIPKTRRALSAADFLEVVELDGKRLDVMVRYPDMRGGWKRCRGVTLVLLADVGTGGIVGWDIRRGENADGVAAAVHMALREYGRMRCLRSDNGSAIDAALGDRWVAEADGVAAGICAQLGIVRNGPPPFRPWSKGGVERAAGCVRDFERWQGIAHWGGSPTERAEERDRQTRDDVMGLPTEEQLRTAFGTWLADVFHAAPCGSQNGLSRSLAMEQGRGHVERVPDEVAELVCSLPEKKARAYGRDGLTVAGWLFRERDAAKHVRLIGRKVIARRVPWTGDFVILTDEAGVVIARPARVALTSVSASADELREVCREQARARRALAQAREARRYLGGSRAAQLAELKRAAALAEEAAVRKALPPPPAQAVTIVAADVAVKAQFLRKTGTAGDVAVPAATLPQREVDVWTLLSAPLPECLSQPPSEAAAASQDDWFAALSDMPSEPDQTAIEREQREREARELFNGAPDAGQGGKSA